MEKNRNAIYIGTSFSLKIKVARICWNIFYLLLFRYSPRPFHFWRSFILRVFGAKVGKKVHVYSKVKIWAPWNIELGDECGIGDGAELYSQGKIVIGKKAVISQDSYLCAGTHDYNHPDFPLITKPIIIGDYVWVAAGAFVHPGLTLNDGCVIGARSVVVRDLPAWMVCAGNPCKPLKERKLARPDAE